MIAAAKQLRFEGERIFDETCSPTAAETRRRQLGQFLTPERLADFMASLFESHPDELNLLDAGAGDGALAAAVLRRICVSPEKPKRVSVTAYEMDGGLIGPLHSTLEGCRQECARANISFSATVLNEDFIAAVVPLVRTDLFASHKPLFNAAIVNPPYRKIHSASSTRLLLRSAGIETSNLYTGFVALITKLLVGGGELVAITPRSFCNGPYFRSFRKDLLDAVSLRRLHVFESRSAAFGRDDVLQENLIVHATVGAAKPAKVLVSSSSGEAGGAITEREVAYDEVVSSDDPERFIHLPCDEGHPQARFIMRKLSTSLSKLGLSVSTGRVVDFRAKRLLRDDPEVDTAPLIYPCHFGGGFVHWPKKNSRKPNAIVSNEHTRELLVPLGNYVLVKRFTSKEERRRVVACIYDSARNRAPLVGFENHLNYFHVDNKGLPITLVRGLAVFLNSTIVDAYFRQFNGHTQVNATDLRSLNYPTRTQLERLGQRIEDPGAPQYRLDQAVAEELF